MREKLPRYFLLSFASFCFFTVVFHTAADAQVVSTSTPLLQAENVHPSIAVPTPTIYMAPPTTPSPTPLILLQKKVPSPTPTIFMQPQQVSPTTQPTPQPTQAVYDTTEITSPSPISSPTPTATTSPTPQPTTQAEPVDIDSLFSQYSTQYNVSEAELEKIAQCESGFNTNANTGTYAGMFQFSATTWESERNAMGLDPNPDLRMDAGEAIRTTAFMLSRGEENAWPNCH